MASLRRAAILIPVLLLLAALLSTAELTPLTLSPGPYYAGTPFTIGLHPDPSGATPTSVRIWGPMATYWVHGVQESQEVTIPTPGPYSIQAFDDSGNLLYETAIVVLPSPEAAATTAPSEEIPASIVGNETTENITTTAPSVITPTAPSGAVPDDAAFQRLSARLSRVTFDRVAYDSARGRYEIDAHGQGRNTIRLRGVVDASNISTIEFAQHPAALATDAVVVEGAVVDNATVRLAKYGAVAAIARCDEYNTTTGSCAAWIPTDIPFSDYGDYIEFTVTHFTGYGGIPQTNFYYVTSASNTSLPNLGASRNASRHNVTRNLAATGLYNFINASVVGVTGRIIRTTDVVNFSGNWTRANALNASVTYKLMYGVGSPQTLVCQRGDDSTGGLNITANSIILSGNCSPASNVTIPNGTTLWYVVNVYRAPATTRVVTLWWDASSPTSMNFTSYQMVDVNVTANASTYDLGQTVNISGYLSWTNTTPLNNSNVTVTFINTTDNSVQSRNVTTNASGFYADTYTLPASAPQGTWKANVTGWYNGSIYATANTSYSVQAVAPNITNASINSTSPVLNSTTIKINASVTDSNLDKVWITVTPPTGAPYNITTSNNANEYYNTTLLNQTGTWNFTFYANDTTNLNSSANATDANGAQNIVVFVYGTLNVTLTTPPDSTGVNQNATFYVNATITCTGASGALCGDITATARYNASSTTPDTAINTTSGAAPFYIPGGGSGSSWNVSFDTVGADGTSNSDYITDASADSDGNLYVTGYSTNSTPNSYTTFLKKYSADGTENITGWNKTKTPDVFAGGSVLVGSSGNITVGISGAGGLAFGELHQYYPNGTEIITGWNKTVGQGISNTVDALVEDHNSTATMIYAMGLYFDGLGGTYGYINKYYDNGTEITGNWPVTGISINLVAAAGAKDSNGSIYIGGLDEAAAPRVKKYNQSGVEITTGWNKLLDALYASLNAIAVDSSDNVYIAGGGNNLVNAASSSDWYIRKYYANGTEIITGWNKSIDDGKNGSDVATSIVIDNAGNITVGGTGTNLKNSTSGSDWWIKRFYPNGTEITTWNQTYDGSGAADQVNALVVFNTTVYAAGYGTNLTNSTSKADAWLMQLSETGGGGGSNPVTNTTSLSLGQSWNVSWLVNATGTNGSKYLVDANFSSSYAGIAANDTSNALVCIGSCSTPPTISSARINASSPVLVNTTVKVNASVNGTGLDTVLLQVTPPTGNPYNTTPLHNSDSGPWYNTSWLYRKNITFNASEINGTLSDFPVVVNLANDTDLSSRAQSSGNDILFTASDGTTRLSHEIDMYNSTSGRLVAWVRIPTFANATNNTIYLYYGNSSVGDQSNKTGVWDSSYLAVYHMSQAPPNIVLDSTGRRNLTQLSTNQSAGQIGGALFLNGTASRLNTTVYTVNLSNFTIEAWVQNNNTASYWGNTAGRPSGGTGWEAIVDIDNNGTPFRDFSVDGETADVGSLVVDDGSSYPATHDKVSGQMSGKAWTHVAVRYSNGTNGPLRGFVNGTMTANTPVENWTTTNARIVVGAYATAGTTFTDYWYGSIDEVRISSTNRSNAWIQTEYKNQRNSTTFTSVGAQEGQGGGGSDEYYNSSITLNISGRWTFTFYANNTQGAAAVPVFAQDGYSNFYIDVAGPPIITNVTSISPVTPLAGQNKSILINFTATSDGGVALLNDSTASAAFTNGTTTRSGSCTPNDQNTTSTVYNCSVMLTHYDQAGVWLVNASVSDTSWQNTSNSTTTFTYNPLVDIQLNTSAYNFGTFNPNSGWQASTSGPVLVDNRGNTNVTLNITAYALTNGSSTINASNFTINITNALGKPLLNNTEVAIPNATVPADTATTEQNRSLYFYINTPMTAPGTYTAQSDWVITAYG